MENRPLLFPPSILYENDGLPRQARDKHIGKDSPKRRFTQVGAHLRRYAHDRKTQGGIRIVQFGQGLTEKIDDPVFQAAVEAVAPGVGLMRSASTYASEEAGGPIGGQQCAQQ